MQKKIFWKWHFSRRRKRKKHEKEYYHSLILPLLFLSPVFFLHKRVSPSLLFSLSSFDRGRLQSTRKDFHKRRGRRSPRALSNFSLRLHNSEFFPPKKEERKRIFFKFFFFFCVKKAPLFPLLPPVVHSHPLQRERERERGDSKETFFCGLVRFFSSSFSEGREEQNFICAVRDGRKKKTLGFFSRKVHFFLSSSSSFRTLSFHFLSGESDIVK